MRRQLLLAAFLLLAENTNATDQIGLKIADLGIEGTRTAETHFARLQIQAENNGTQTRSFSLRVYEANLLNDVLPASNVYVIPLILQPSEKRTIDVPLRLSNNQTNSVLFAEAVDEKGAPLGIAARRFWRSGNERAIGLFCASDETCKSIRQAILLSGTAEEQTRKSQGLQLIQVRKLPRVWWAYTAVNNMVIAGPTSGLTKEQTDALEAFTLRGGTIVLAEKEMGGAKTKGSPFADSLPSQTNGEPKPAGRGTIVRISSVSSADFSSYFRVYGFAASTPGELAAQFQRYQESALKYPDVSLAGWLQEGNATKFKFPGTLELILWMAGYLLLLIAVNFLLLRRLGKPELAWVTIPVLAIAFSLILYKVSARNRPTEYGLDELRYYQLDGDNTLAIAEARLQISAPHKGMVPFTVPREFIYDPPQGYQDGGEISYDSGVDGGRPGEIKLGESWESSDYLRVWSSSSFMFNFVHRFPGTVTRAAENRLQNESGVDFEDALLVTRDTVYMLGRLPTGGFADLKVAKKIPYAQAAGYFPDGYGRFPSPPFAIAVDVGDEVSERRRSNGLWRHTEGAPYSLEEIVRGWPIDGQKVFAQTKAVFLGRGKDVTAAGSLVDISARKRSDAVYVVTYRDWK